MARILFLQKIWSENLGPMYLSALLKARGHHVGLLISEHPAAEPQLQGFRPDLLAFSLTTGTHLWALRQAQAIKRELNAPVIFGGAHPTYFPEVIEEEGVDIVCRGEGEAAMVELAARLDDQREYDDIANLWLKKNGGVVRNPLRPLLRNLDGLPFPDRELYYQYAFLRENPTKAFISGRGCPYSCSYCATATLREIYQGHGAFTRFRAPELVVEEICEVRERYGLRTVCFQDDTFILKSSRLQPLLELYGKRVGLPFICHVRADLVTEPLVKQLKDAGCHSVDFGLESGDQQRRFTLLKKTVTDHELWTAAALFRKYRIPYRTTNMLGLPGETIEMAWQTIKLNQRLRTVYPSCSVYQPYPRTELGDRVISEGLAGCDYNVNSIATTFYKKSTFETPQAKLFTNLQKFFSLAVKHPWTLPLIKQLIKLPPNPLFDWIFLFTYALNYRGSENISWTRVLQLGKQTIRGFFFGDNSQAAAAH